MGAVDWDLTRWDAYIWCGGWCDRVAWSARLRLGGFEGGFGFGVGEVVCECLQGNQDLSNVGGDLAMAWSSSIVAVSNRDGNRDISTVVFIEFRQPSSDLRVLLRR